MSKLKNLPADWRKGRKPHDNYTNAGRYPKGSTGPTGPTGIGLLLLIIACLALAAGVAQKLP